MARPEVVAVGIDECDCFLCRRSVKVGPGCGDDRCGCSVFPAASRTRRASFKTFTRSSQAALVSSSMSGPGEGLIAPR